MLHSRRLIAILIVTALASSSAWAWNMAGHMTTAAIAYDVLLKQNPKTVEKVVALLQQHPQYEKLWAKKLEKVAAEDRDQALFMLAARWPDDIRNDPDYHHGPWHYIDYPYKPPGQPESVRTAPPPDPNIETAYRANVEVLTGKGTAAEKAIALCWIMHLTGDSHQPLHSVSMFTTELPAPEGDKGGNLQFIRAKPDADPITLHWFWDGLVIGSDDTREVHKKAIELREKYPRKQLDPHPKNVTPNDMANWIQESFELAKTAVYLNGTLITSTVKSEAPVLPAEYVSQAKPIGEQRATQAGYRLADVLVKNVP